MPKKYSKAFLITKVDSLEKLMIASDWLVSAESHRGQILFDFAISCDITRYYGNFFINTHSKIGHFHAFLEVFDEFFWRNFVTNFYDEIFWRNLLTKSSEEFFDEFFWRIFILQKIFFTYNVLAIAGQVFTKASDMDLVRMIQVNNSICLLTTLIYIKYQPPGFHLKIEMPALGLDQIITLSARLGLAWEISSLQL